MNQSNWTCVYHAKSGVQRLIFSALERVMQDLSYRTLIWAELRWKPQDKKNFKIFEGRQISSNLCSREDDQSLHETCGQLKSGETSDFGTKPVKMGRVWSKNYHHTIKDHFKTYSMCSSIKLATKYEGNILSPTIKYLGTCVGTCMCHVNITCSLP